MMRVWNDLNWIGLVAAHVGVELSWVCKREMKVLRYLMFHLLCL